MTTATHNTLQTNLSDNTSAAKLGPEPAPAASTMATVAPTTPAAAVATAPAACASAPAAASAAAATPAATATRHAHCTYADCIAGRAPIPQSGPGKAAFQLLMVGGMVTFMATFNGVLGSGLSFFANAHWMYPLIFCIAFLVRLYVGDPIIGFLAPRLVMPHFRGCARGVAMTLLNVAVMGVIMGSVITMLMHGPSGFFAQLASSLPLTMPTAALVSFFIVGPAVKMIYNNLIEPTAGFGLFHAAERYVMPWTFIFGN